MKNRTIKKYDKHVAVHIMIESVQNAKSAECYEIVWCGGTHCALDTLNYYIQ